jgi:hypothetical protein
MAWIFRQSKPSANRSKSVIGFFHYLNLMKSKFDMAVLRPVIIFLFLSFGIGVLSTLMFKSLMPFYLYLFYLAFILVWLWLLLVVLRKKMVSVRVDGGQIIVRGFLGLGIASTYSFNELDGYKTSNLASRYGFFEHLYLIKEGKKVAGIGGSYHRNYPEMKAAITPFLTDLGYEPYHIKNEFKEIF